MSHAKKERDFLLPLCPPLGHRGTYPMHIGGDFTVDLPAEVTYINGPHRFFCVTFDCGARQCFKFREVS